ncbi:hypothetical protein ACFC09_40995 [Streptomyces sp. NPDC056161]|uniref:hypothetical protein n=1 Tax=Streptomyces sp. NPDC056161 TaxID=3345732 RepID=UPI0035D7BD47
MAEDEGFETAREAEATERAVAGREQNALVTWEFARALDYGAGSELDGPAEDENETWRAYALLKNTTAALGNELRNVYAAGSLGDQAAQNTAAEAYRQSFDEMEDWRYAYIAAANLHEDVRGQRLDGEQTRQEILLSQARHLEEAGQRAAAVWRLLPPGTSGRPARPDRNAAARAPWGGGRRNSAPRRLGKGR